MGAGIQVGPNGARLLQAMGLRQEIEAWAVRSPRGLMMNGVSGQKICAYPLDSWSVAELGLPFYQIHRADLQAVLVRALRQRLPDVLITDTCLESVENQESGCSVTDQKGNTYQADLLLGCDGVHSQLRELEFDQTKPRYSGRVAWRSLVPTANLPDELRHAARVWTGPGRHLVQYPVRRGTLMNIVACVESPQSVPESWQGQTDTAALQTAFQDWCPQVTTLVGQMREALCWGLYERAVLPFVVKNRLVLLGDAAHAMLPSMAQGAVMSMEDGYQLAMNLSAEKEIAEALQFYQVARQKRNARVQETARRNMHFFHQLGGLVGYAQRAMLKNTGASSEWIIGKRYAWIYGFDIEKGSTAG